MPEPVVSVIIRVRSEAANLERCLKLLATQRLESPGQSEVLVVDAASRDGTAAVAHRAGARVIETGGGRFSFGDALNLGAANARGEILIALSAHAFPRDDGWLQRMVLALSTDAVACASGDTYGPDGERLSAPVFQDLALARRRPEWGYSNAAGAFRASLWRRRPFRGDLPGCEDKEWALYWLAEGYTSVIDPSLAVDHDHTHDSLRSIYRRARREAAAYAHFADLPPYGRRELIQDWWRDTRWYDSAARARASHRRAARLLGAYAGRRGRG